MYIVHTDKVKHTHLFFFFSFLLCLRQGLQPSLVQISHIDKGGFEHMTILVLPPHSGEYKYYHCAQHLQCGACIGTEEALGSGHAQ